MKHLTGNLSGFEGMKLYYQAWHPDEPVCGILVIVHGAGDHSGRYARLVEPLVGRGFSCYGYDQRGYGLSDGQRGHIDAWRDFREDLRIFLDLVKREQPAAPVFLFGFSLGTMVVLDFILREPQAVQGAILCGAAIEPAGVGSPLKKAAARVLSRIAPRFSLSLVGDYDAVTRDAQIIASLRSDPLHHNLVTARWGAESMATHAWVMARAAQIRLPVFFVHGSDDRLNLPGGMQRYVEQITYPDKTVRLYPGSRHEVHNDLDHALLASDVAAWMEARIPEANSRKEGE